MNGLLGALELLGQAPLAQAQQRLVDIARSSGSGLLAVLNDVLDYAKLDADQVAIRPQPTELRALVASVVALFSAPAHAKRLVLRGQVDDTVPPWVQADTQRLRQVLLNLVGNAVKFTDTGEIALRVGPADGGLRFEVRDTGIGIEPQACKQLFEPFLQVHDGSDRSHGGTGLGLAISQRLVRAMGGDIAVDSTLGAGSCFGFTLALPLAQAPVAEAPVDTTTLGLPPAAARCVLLAEDNDVNRVLAVELLKVLDVDVVVAVDGLQALDRLHQGGIDMVLMDCQMPRLDGYEATRQWRAHEQAAGLPRLPVVALTANVMSEDIERTRQSGMDDLLGKPYTVEQLRAVLRRWLPGHGG
jgi:CheY-like chemotaxis protein